MRWEKTTVDQFDAVVERAAVNLHRSFAKNNFTHVRSYFFFNICIFDTHYSMYCQTYCSEALFWRKFSLDLNFVELSPLYVTKRRLWIRLYLKQIVSSWLLLDAPRVKPFRLHLKRKFLYREIQPIYTEMATKLNVAFKKVTNLDFVQNVDNYLLIFVDSCEEVTKTRSL